MGLSILANLASLDVLDNYDEDQEAAQKRIRRLALGLRLVNGPTAHEIDRSELEVRRQCEHDSGLAISGQARQLRVAALALVG